MGSHNVTFHPTQVNTPRLNPSHIGQYSIYRPQKDGGLSKPRPRVRRATGPRLLCERLRLAGLELRPRDRYSSTLTTRLSRRCNRYATCLLPRFLDQELISYRDLYCCSSCWYELFKKHNDFLNGIGVKFSRIVLQV